MSSVSGVRGIIGKDLTPPVITNYVHAFVQSLDSPRLKIVIGRDTRKSGQFIEKIVEGSLLALGCDVLNLGIATTPTILLMARKLNSSGGIAITASHNPQQWNALKFCNSRGLFLNKEEASLLKEQVSKDQALPEGWKEHARLGKLQIEPNAHTIHIEEVLKHINRNAIKKKRFRVGIDPVGSTGSMIDRPFLETLNCTVVGIHESRQDTFPRNPQPTARSLEELSRLVRNERLDVGFAQDPDGDRLSIVDETGHALGEEYSMVLAGEAYLRKKKSDIVCNLSTSMMVDDLAERFGLKVHRTEIGEINVTEKLLQQKLFYGGEGNGGVIVPEINPCRDSIVAMGLILELLALRDEPLSRIVSGFPAYAMKKMTVSVEDKDKKGLYSGLLVKAKENFVHYQIDLLDGIKIYNKNEWLHLRFSNTEPLLRVMAESENRARTDELLEKGTSMINQ